MLNHLPIIGSVILLFFFAHAIIFKKENIIRLSYIFFIIIGAMAALVYITGDPSAEIVEKLPGVKESIIEEHENYAVISLLLFILSGMLSIFALVSLYKKKLLPAWFIYSVLVVSFISVVAVSYTAKTGGEIMHPEISNQLPNELND